ncbi:MAG: hypothetical protein A2X31_09315 [Elusimicrobia bacterium GWB2_63_22]|nr:MAG: hypothetical protein A2X31_09315 [Elusimicrobia bacterium GWB2_63_22]
MEAPEEIPANIPCPYCGAANPAENEFCGACLNRTHVPKEVRAGAKAEKLLRSAPGGSAAAPERDRPAARSWGRLVLIAALFLFYTRWLANDNYFSPLDYVNLAFHEAGHVFLGFFGRFISVLGGTLFQLLLPAVCLAHLARRGSNLGWQLCLFWTGQSLLNVSIYAGDAIKQALPLVGGGEHDWTYLLTELGLIAHTGAVAKFIFLCGSAVIFWSFYLISRDAKTREPFNFG